MFYAQAMPEDAMPLREYWLCGCCGANSRDKEHYVHSEFCIINLPTCTDGTIAAWKSGKEYYEQTSGRGRFYIVNRYYVMGWNFARARAESEKTLNALDQATDALRKKKDAMSERLVPRYE